jgi:hypothetical protein
MTATSSSRSNGALSIFNHVMVQTSSDKRPEMLILVNDAGLFCRLRTFVFGAPVGKLGSSPASGLRSMAGFRASVSDASSSLQWAGKLTRITCTEVECAQSNNLTWEIAELVCGATPGAPILGLAPSTRNDRSLNARSTAG